MVYEIYADRLFFLHLFMNMYMLALVNHMLHNAVTIKRILWGAFLGASVSVIFMFCPIPIPGRLLAGGLISVLLMGTYTFRAYRIRQFLQVLEKMLITTLLMGGLLVFILRFLPSGGQGCIGLMGVIGLGTVCYMLSRKLLERKKGINCFCKVFLLKGNDKLELNALMDTGNTLKEPISGKPVMLMEEKNLEYYFDGELPEIYRVIPYHSVGKKTGWLKGYLLKEIIVEVQGIPKECKDIYVATSNEIFTKQDDYHMILNPEILE